MTTENFPRSAFDPFAVLGLPRAYALDPGELERRYRAAQRACHPDRFRAATPSERRAAAGRSVEVNEAYRTLRDSVERAAALLRVEAPAAGAPPDDPELLMEMLELRESMPLDDSETSRAARASTGARVRADAARAEAEFARAMDVRDVASAGRALGRLRYLRRVLDELRALDPG